MTTTSHHRHRLAPRQRPEHQAFLLLRTVFTIAPIVFGLDKFFDVMTDWDAVPRAVDQRPRAGHRPPGHAAGGCHRDRGRRAGRRPPRHRRLRRGRLAGRDHRQPALRGRTTTTWPCATSACWSAPSPWLAWPSSPARPAMTALPSRPRPSPVEPWSPPTGPRAAPDGRARAVARRADARRPPRAVSRTPSRELLTAPEFDADHVRQRRGVRRAGARPRHPDAVGLRAPPAAVRRRRPRRLPAGRPHPRAVEACSRTVDHSPVARRPRNGSPCRSPAPVSTHLAPRGVGVVIEAEHSCMSLRGVAPAAPAPSPPPCSDTSATTPPHASEFLALTRGDRR